MFMKQMIRGPRVHKTTVTGYLYDHFKLGFKAQKRKQTCFPYLRFVILLYAFSMQWWMWVNKQNMKIIICYAQVE